MQKLFSWQNFDRMAKALESIGYVTIALGPLLGIGIMIFGGSAVSILAGLGVIVASILIAMYHYSFALLMYSIRSLTVRLKLPPIEDVKSMDVG